MRSALFLFFSASLFAQSVEIGVEGGVPLTHDFSTYAVKLNDGVGTATQLTLPYVVGPALQIRLWRPLYLDVQGLYSRGHYMLVGILPPYNVPFGTDHRVDRWEFPVLLKMQLTSWHSVHPFVAGGVSFQYNRDSTVIIPIPGETIVSPRVIGSAIGPAFAAGASFGSRRIRPSIEFRYTRWADSAINSGIGGTVALRSKQDEAQVLAGLMFGVGGSQPNSPGILEGPPRSRRVTLGIKGGLVLNQGFSTQQNFGLIYPFSNCFDCGSGRSLPYIVGPALEVRIIGRWSATAEALYAHADYNHTSFISHLSAGFVDSREKHSVGRWEGPFLLKYSFSMRHLTPFVTAGASIQYDRDSRVRAVYAAYCYTCLGRFQAGVYAVRLDTTSGPPMGSLVAGPTGGVGASFWLGRVRSSIEARYTYWTDPAIAVYPPPPEDVFPVPVYSPTIRSTHNEVHLLVGIMF